MSWDTPQGVKTVRKGDHQAVVDMVIVKVINNEFKTVGQVPGKDAIGPDTCERF
jgi:branched-chain amino acid transport system substrate-binding protein